MLGNHLVNIEDAISKTITRMMTYRCSPANHTKLLQLMINHLIMNAMNQNKVLLLCTMRRTATN